MNAEEYERIRALFERAEKSARKPSAERTEEDKGLISQSCDTAIDLLAQKIRDGEVTIEEVERRLKWHVYRARMRRHRKLVSVMCGWLMGILWFVAVPSHPWMTPLIAGFASYGVLRWGLPYERRKNP